MGAEGSGEGAAAAAATIGAVLGMGEESTQEAGTLSTGSMSLMSPEQLALLLQQLTNFSQGQGAYSKFGFDNKAFQEGTVNPVVANLQETMKGLTNQYAGQGTGSEKKAAVNIAGEKASGQIGQAFAQQSAAMQQAKMQAYLQEMGILLGAKTKENYAVVQEGSAESGNAFTDNIVNTIKGVFS